MKIMPGLRPKQLHPLSYVDSGRRAGALLAGKAGVFRPFCCVIDLDFQTDRELRRIKIWFQGGDCLPHFHVPLGCCFFLRKRLALQFSLYISSLDRSFRRNGSSSKEYRAMAPWYGVCSPFFPHSSHSHLLSRAPLAWLLATPPSGELALRLWSSASLMKLNSGY